MLAILFFYPTGYSVAITFAVVMAIGMFLQLAIAYAESRAANFYGGTYQCVQAEVASFHTAHCRSSLPFALLHYAPRLNLGVRCHIRLRDTMPSVKVLEQINRRTFVINPSLEDKTTL